MLDAPLHQAAGLQGLALTQPPLLLAVLAHGHARTEQPVLWQLGNALAGLGYRATVLDGTVHETEHNPGLAQLLDAPGGQPGGLDTAPAWGVLPAAAGLQDLCSRGSRPAASRQRLGQAFGGNEVIVLYAGVAPLVHLLGQSGLRPLLTVPQDTRALLTTYLALKHLLRRGRLEPVILHMMQAGAAGADAAAVAHALQACAAKFLGYAVKPVDIDADQAEAALDAQWRRLATVLLEQAVALYPGPAGAWPAMEFARTAHREVSRSH